MNGSTAMTVNLRVPVKIIHQGPAERLTAKAENGSFGVLPNHIDFVAALVPGVLMLVEPGGHERIARGRCHVDVPDVDRHAHAQHLGLVAVVAVGARP